MNEEPAVDPVSMISLSLSHFIMRELEWNYGFLCFLFVQVNFLSSFFFFSIVGTFLFWGGSYLELVFPSRVICFDVRGGEVWSPSSLPFRD